MMVEMSIFLAALLLWVVIFFGEFTGKPKKISVLYGYPPKSRTWLTIYHCRSTDRWVFEWDDLFDSGRPRSMYPLSQNMMFPDKESGATPEEHTIAMAMLKARAPHY